VTAIVRRATAADLPRLGRLGALLIEEHHGYDSRRFLAPGQWTPADYAAYLGAQLGDPSSTVLVAEDNGEVIGYAYAVVEGYDYMALRGPAGILHDLIVEPRARGSGAGRLLVEAILADLKSRGVPRVVLHAAERNAPAQRFFARHGFRPTMIEMTRDLDDEG
jgi:ribosomal protein S18 acetylase RimI-like enzyme